MKINYLIYMDHYCQNIEGEHHMFGLLLIMKKKQE